MTWYLTPAPKKEATPAPSKRSTVGDVYDAAWNVETIETDAWNRRDGERNKVYAEIRNELGSDRQIYADKFVMHPRAKSRPSTQRKITMIALADLMKKDPEKFGHLLQDEKAIDAEVTRRLKAEHEKAMSVLGMGGYGAGTVEFAGRGARAFTDQVNLGLMLVGGPTSGIVRTIATEAGLGVVGELATISKQQKVSEELDLPKPNVAVQLATAGIVSGAIAGVIKGAGHGYSYMKNRRAASREAKPDDVSSSEFDAAVDEAEAALRNNAPMPTTTNITDQNLAGTVRRIIGVESAGNPNAKAKTSSAGGLGQFIDSTWLTMIKRYRPDLARGQSDTQILARKYDADLNFEMTTRFTQENRDGLRNAGLPHGMGEIYLAHFAGLGGAKTILRGNPDAHISTVFGADKIKANANIKFAGKYLSNWTVRDLRRWAEHKMGQAPDPGDSYGATTRAGYTRPDEVSTAAGRRISVEYEVIDADLLRAASGDLQPRDRSRASSDEQIAEIAARLDPARLMPSPEADRGAPIVGPDNVVESGNGRVAAINQARARFTDRHEAYVKTIKAAGFTIPEGVKNPILIARRTSELDDAARIQFVRDANTSTIARMSATEQSRMDADAIDKNTLSFHKSNARLSSPENRLFIQAVLGRIPQAERSGLVNAKGQLNADGVRRIKQALFAAAYDAPDILKKFAEDNSNDVRTITDALSEVAADWAKLKADIAAGIIRPEMDASVNLMDAVRIVAEARQAAIKNGQSVSSSLSDIMAQSDLLSGSVDAVTSAFVGVLYRGNRARSADDIVEILKNYVTEAKSVGKTEAGLFGHSLDAKPEDILNAVKTEKTLFNDSGQPVGGRRIVSRSENSGKIPEGSQPNKTSRQPSQVSSDKTIDRLARHAAPAVFLKYDILIIKQKNLRRWIVELTKDVKETPVRLEQKIQTFNDQIKNAKGKAAKYSLRNKIREAKTALKELHNLGVSTETADVAVVRKQLLAVDVEMRDMAVDISAAYKVARKTQSGNFNQTNTIQIDGIDDTSFDVGAGSRVLSVSDDAATLKIRNELKEGDTSFGPVHAELNDQPDLAIKYLMEAKTGEVPAATHHPELGDIAFVYGGEEFGLRHIFEKHGVNALNELPDALQRGTIIERLSDRVYIETNDTPPRKTVVRLDWNGSDKNWVLTTYDNIRGMKARQVQTSDEPLARTSSRIPDATEQTLNSTSKPKKQADDPIRAELAALRDNISPNDFEIQMPDGLPYRASEVLDDIDGDVDLAEVLNLCSPKGSA